MVTNRWWSDRKQKWCTWRKEKLVILNKDTIKLDSNVIINNAILVDDIYNLVPNYLRKTEAELNLDKKS